MVQQELPPTEPNLFERECNELYNWPYSIYRLENTLDKNLIQGRGRQLLFQSLAKEHLTVYLGSGTSMAYGRFGWYEWLDAHIKELGQTSKALQDILFALKEKIVFAQTLTCKIWAIEEEEENPTSNKTPGTEKKKYSGILDEFLTSNLQQIDAHNSELISLHKTFTDCTDEGEFIGGDTNAITFQIANKLHDLIRDIIHVYFTKDLTHYHEESGSAACGAMSKQIEEYLNEWHETGQNEVFNVSPPTKLAAVVTYLVKEKEVFPNIIEPKDPMLFMVDNISLCTKMAVVAAYLVKEKEKFPAIIKPDVIDELNGFKDFYSNNNALCDVIAHPQFSKSFEDISKLLLVDDCPHAEYLVHKAFFECATKREKYEKNKVNISDAVLGHSYDEGALHRNFKGFYDNPNRYAALGFMERKALSNFVKHNASNKKEWKALFTTLGNIVAADTKAVIVTPIYRFIFEMCAQLDSKEVLWMAQKKAMNPKFYHKFRSGDLVMRCQHILEEQDVLKKLYHLNARHYLTANYDFEVEKLFRDEGYTYVAGGDCLPTAESDKTQPMDASLYFTDAAGGIFKDKTFTRENAVDLAH